MSRTDKQDVVVNERDMNGQSPSAEHPPKRNLKDYILISVKGFAMGSADVIPGVSGGTIAFITGIYEELISSLKSIGFHAVKKLFKSGPAAFWNHINGNFLLALFVGIGLAVVSLAKALSFVLENYPVLIWAFFFGLILASAWIVAKKIKKWSAGVIVSLIAGAAIAWFITSATQKQTPDDLWFIFLSGMIAICAMILPGISGSFILLILGKYKYILDTVKNITQFRPEDILTIITFMLGCLTGLLAFSHVLNWLFRKFHDLTVALLTGFMIGSLNKVWPWKRVIETYLNSKGEEHPSAYENIMPETYGVEVGTSYLWGAILLAIAGMAIVIVLDRVSFDGKTEDETSV